MTRPVIGITMGDAAGIGPEIIVKALVRPETADICRPVVIGDARRLTEAARRAHVDIDVRPVDMPLLKGSLQLRAVDCIDLRLIPTNLPFGELSAAAGEAAFRYLEHAVALARTGEIDAICTAPINKAALHL